MVQGKILVAVGNGERTLDLALLVEKQEGMIRALRERVASLEATCELLQQNQSRLMANQSELLDRAEEEFG